MLKKIRHGFIAAAMASYGVVMLVLVAGINIANYMQTASMQDQLAMDLMLYGPRAFRHPGEGGPSGRKLPGRGAEAEFITRFFTVSIDSEGETVGQRNT